MFEVITDPRGDKGSTKQVVKLNAKNVLVGSTLLTNILALT